MNKKIFGIVVCTLMITAVVLPLIGNANENKNKYSMVLNEQAKLLASDGVAYDEFGFSVSISGDYALIGSPYDDDGGDGSGSAYVFKRSGSSWTELAKLTASDAASLDYFGRSVSIDGDYALVGAIGNDDNGDTSGSTYVFKRSGSTWTEQVKLTASDGDPFDSFGHSVSIDGDYALIGAKGYDGAIGAAYVFKRSGSTWTEEAILTASDGDYIDDFGWSVSINGYRALIGAVYDDDHGAESGSAYVFKRSGSTWTEEAKLTASDADADDRFGFSVSIDGDYALIGAKGNDDDGDGSGSAYVFMRSGSSWIEQVKLTASDGDTADIFGQSVSIDGYRALVGASGNEAYAGAAYVFKRSGSTWTEEIKLNVSDAAPFDNLGHSVSIDGDYVLVGSAADDDNGENSGSAYIFGNLWLNHKMHYPQLPDPNGWDVFATYPFWNGVLADDWMCSESGYVFDIHFWGSWLSDIVGNIDGFYISIYDDIPAGVGGLPYSRPGNLLWEQYIVDFEEVIEFNSTQGWYDPWPGIVYTGDHFGCFRYDIINMSNPFYQIEGTIYWLAITANVTDGEYPGPLWGWKTSLDHWNDAAVWLADPPSYWDPLEDPIAEESLDLAFVITAEEPDEPPTACYTWVDADSYGPGTTIDFDASCSTDDIGITMYEWDWTTDGSYDYSGGPTTSHNYGDYMWHNCTLRVTDTAGNIDTFTDMVKAVVESEDVNQSVHDRGFPIRHALDGDWAAAQNFSVSVNTLTRVEIRLRKFGTPAFNLTVELRENHPQGILHDTVIFTPSGVPSSWEWFEVDFSDTVVTSTGDYFIVIPPAPSGVTTSFGYEWGYAFGDQYWPGSFWFTRDGGGLWRDLPTVYEFVFKTFGY